MLVIPVIPVMLVIPVMFVMCVIPVMCVMCYVLCLVSFYLPPHPFQRVFFNFFKSLSGSTCLTEPFLFRVFGVFGVFEVFKVVRRVQRLNRYSMVTPC